MLDRRCEVLLDTLISNGYTYPQDKFQSIDETLIPILPDNSKFHWSFDSISTCIEYLIEHEYVNGESFYKGYYPVSDYRLLHVTYKGQHYKDFKRSEFLNSIFKSILLPVIASLITTLIVSACSYIWGMSSLKIHADNLNPNKQPTTYEINCVNIE